MKAVQINPDDKSLNWGEVEDPVPGNQDVLIEVHATAINRADLVQREGRYPPPPGASPVMGLECAGKVVQTGDKVSRYKVGDKVCALLAGGGYAEYASVHEGSVVPVPEGFSFEQAACLPEVFATAWLNLFMEAALRPGERVLLHAGASGVGTAGIQLCKAFGSPCFVTAGADEKIAACIDLGASGGANRKADDFVEQVAGFASDGGIDVILDPVGAAYLGDNIQYLSMNGRLVLIGLMGGTRAELDLAQMMMKRLRVIGSTLRARPVEEKAAIMGELESRVWPLLAKGDIKPILDTVFPITEVSKAHELIASDTTIGKVVLSTR